MRKPREFWISKCSGCPGLTEVGPGYTPGAIHVQEVLPKDDTLKYLLTALLEHRKQDEPICYECQMHIEQILRGAA